MDLDTVTAQSPFPRTVRARGAGVLILVLTAGIAAMYAYPVTAADDYSYGARDGYPPMLVPLILALAGAAVFAACRPAAARAAAVLCGLAGLQVAGIAMVASSWWYANGAYDNEAHRRAGVGFQVSLTMAALAFAAVAAGAVLYHYGPAPRRSPATHVGGVVAGVTVAVALPVVVCLLLGRSVLVSAGQFALWWSLPWGLGLVGAQVLPTPATRRAAALGVVASVLIVAACVTVYAWRAYMAPPPD